ncbi:MAG: ABC transporter substrate-binding protein, partial [Clostridiales bacterium]|nr:ABC transporter substrate-binding protein [Clostridiales bacterium]
MKKITALLLMFIVCISLISACSNEPAPAPTPPPTAAPVPTQDTSAPETEEPEFVNFTDSVGRTVEVPSSVERISPTGTLSQMFLLAIAPDLMVTVASDYTQEQAQYIPDYVTQLPVIGQFYGTADINFETIASANPEIVIDVGEPKGTVVEDMDEIMTTVAIPSVHITATLNSTPEAFRMLGQLLGREEKGEQLAQFCEKLLAQTDDIMKKVGDNKVNALYC